MTNAQVKKNLMVDSKLLTIEPGNATRYQFLISQTDREELTVVDLYGKQVFTLNYEWLHDADMAENHIVVQMLDAGYSLGDANPVAKQLLPLLHQSATITYQFNDWAHVEWFNPNEEGAYQRENALMKALGIPKRDYKFNEYFNKQAPFLAHDYNQQN